MPSYTEIGQKVQDINTINADYLHKKTDGIGADEYFTLAAKYAKIVFTQEDKKNKSDFDEVLKKKDPNVDYKEWVNSELTKKDEFTAEIEKNDAIIAGIIPTYSELSIDNSIFERNRITLSDLVSFVENGLLKKNNLTSYSNVGFSNLTFQKAQSSVISIGTYKMNLELSGTNENLSNFINVIQNSGRLTIEKGKLVAPKNIAEEPFSNLLISIDQLSFTQPIESPTKDNKMTANLVFYVRAKSYSDLLKIRSSLADSTKILYDDVKKTAELCMNMSADYCKNDATLKSIQAVRDIAPEAKAFDTLMQASLKATTVQDVA